MTPTEMFQINPELEAERLTDTVLWENPREAKRQIALWIALAQRERLVGLRYMVESLSLRVAVKSGVLRPAIPAVNEHLESLQARGFEAEIRSYGIIPPRQSSSNLDSSLVSVLSVLGILVCEERRP